MAVVNEYECTFLKDVQLIDFVNDRMLPAEEAIVKRGEFLLRFTSDAGLSN